MTQRDLSTYLDEVILPQYDSYDRGHGRDHIEQVIAASRELAADYDVDAEMVATAAYFHDLGLIEGRETHHMTSARMLRADEFICGWFTPAQVETIAQAIEDHRASLKGEPRSIYGKILSSADRVIDAHTIVKRSYYHSLKHYEGITLDENIERIYQHVSAKYGEGGYITIPILTKQNQEGLAHLREILRDEQTFKRYTLEVIESL